MKKELFMLDSTESDGPAEIVMDYILSYTLRSVNNNNTPLFAKYARSILFKLLEINDFGQIVERVEVWKQWGEGHKKIDLTVEVDIIDDGVKYRHAILIEDKYYSGIRYDENLQEYQIQTYKRIFDNFYNDKKTTNHYWVISCISSTDPKFNQLYDFIKFYGYKAVSIYQLVEDIKVDCESDIFNQFFLTGWC